MTLTQDAFRFYEDGTEAGSTAIAAQDVGIERSLDSPNLLLRVRVQSDAEAGASTDAYELQFTRNFVDGWTRVETNTQYVNGYASASLTEGGATTERLTGGTGTFAAGKVSEDGTVDDVAVPEDGYTELVWAITLDAARLSEGDHITFRVRHNEYPRAIAQAKRARVRRRGGDGSDYGMIYVNGRRIWGGWG